MVPGHTRKRGHQVSCWSMLARLRPLVLPVLTVVYAGGRAVTETGTPCYDITIGTVLAVGVWFAPRFTRLASQHREPGQGDQICPPSMLGTARTRPYHQE